MTYKKKLIEVALPLDAINKASAREKSIRHGHPSTLHLWWARRPLAAARAVIFAQMVDDPSSLPDLFPTEKKQEKERQRLFKIIEDLVQWENTTNEEVLERARGEIWQSWRRACAENVDHARAKELFDRKKLPAFHDPFAGGGAIPLEAHRLGLESWATDLNPVAVLINKALLEVPSRFARKPPVNAEARRSLASSARGRGADGIAEDVRHYGNLLREQAWARIGRFYPDVVITPEIAHSRPDLKAYKGKSLKVIAWLWARTVKSPNPAFARVDVPLVSSFLLSTKPGKEAYVHPEVTATGYRFTIRTGKPSDFIAAKEGTKTGRGNFRCVMSSTPIDGDYIKREGRAGRLGMRLMALVAEGTRGRVYLDPTPEMEELARSVKSEWVPEGTIVEDPRAFTPTLYGIREWRDMFTERQLLALTTFSDLAGEIREAVKRDALSAGMADGAHLGDGGNSASAYADAIAMYLGMAVSRYANACTTLCTWNPGEKKEDIRFTFSRQALAMTWDFAEGNPFSDSSGNLADSYETWVYKALKTLPSADTTGHAEQADAANQHVSRDKVVSTDPPYFDNVPYADLSDFFYVWLRRSMKQVFPDLFATVEVPKAEELVAFAYRHSGNAEAASQFFMNGMQRAMHQVASQAHPAFPVTIYYAFKQAETDAGETGGTASTGWETFLDAAISAGLVITGTWPVRTEREGRTRGIESNALASSIVLACRRRDPAATTITRRDFLTELKRELPEALKHLQHGNIAPVDLAQAAIGPGMAVYSRHAKVLDADGAAMPVRSALTLINQVLDEALAEQEGDFDADSRWAVAWFEHSGFAEGEYGVAETLSKAKNTSVRGLEEAGILKSSRGKVRLLKTSELPTDWDPTTDPRLTAWEVVHHLIRALDAGGELGAATLVAKLGAKAEVARELAYRLYALCERKKRAPEALTYNGLVQSWPEITRLAREATKGQRGTQAGLFDRNEE